MWLVMKRGAERSLYFFFFDSIKVVRHRTKCVYSTLNKQNRLHHEERNIILKLFQYKENYAKNLLYDQISTVEKDKN